MPNDLKYAWRALRARPGYAALSMLILTLGIGATTAIYGAAHAVLFAALPYAAPDGIVFVWDRAPERPLTNLTPGRLVDLQVRGRSFDGLAGLGHLSFTMTGVGTPERLAGASVSANFFDVLGVVPSRGRVFHAGETDRYQVVLSDALWRRRFGADPALVGSALTLDGRSYTVSGVLPPDFYWTTITPTPTAGPHPEMFAIAPDNDLPGLPVAYDGDLRQNRSTGYLRGVARLRRGVTLEQAQAEVAALSLQLAVEHPRTDERRSVVLVSATRQLLGPVRAPVLLLLAAAALLLAASCANVANLQLIRLAERSRDLLVQTALGAEPRRLARQLVLEASILAASGGIGGLAVGSVALRVLKAVVPMEIPRLAHATMDWRAGVCAVLLATACGIAIALLPLVRIARGQAMAAADRSRTSRVSSRTRRILVAAEVATAVVLVSGAVLFGESFARLQRVDVGIQGVDRLLTFNLVLGGDRRTLPGPERVAFYDLVLDRIRAIPGVEHAAVAATLPIGGDDFGTSVIAEGHEAEDPRAVGYQVVGTDWFATLGVRLLRGRDFTSADTGAQGDVVLVNQAFAEEFWPGADAVGRRVRDGRDDEWMTVVGVVENLRHLGPKRPPRPELYEPQYQRSFSFTAVAVRTAGDPHAIVEQVRHIVASLDRGQPISSVATMGEHLRRAQAETQSLSSLTALFGVLSLVIAALGVYGAVGFSVAQRMREFGVRLALGAAPRQIGAQVVRETLATCTLGVIAGTMLALAGARLVRALLFDTPPTDVFAYGTTALAVALTALLAAALPSRAAMSADPASVLRAE
jgi:putative ABC transport system permease protein